MRPRAAPLQPRSDPQGALEGLRALRPRARADKPRSRRTQDYRDAVSSPKKSGSSATAEPEWQSDLVLKPVTIPAFNTSKPWTRSLVVYWTLVWVLLCVSSVWTVYTLDVWPLAVWCALSLTAVIAITG